MLVQAHIRVVCDTVDFICIFDSMIYDFKYLFFELWPLLKPNFFRFKLQYLRLQEYDYIWRQTPMNLSEIAIFDFFASISTNFNFFDNKSI